MPNEPLPTTIASEALGPSVLAPPAARRSAVRRLASLAWADRRVRALVILLLLADLAAVLLHVGYLLAARGIIHADWLYDPAFYMKYGGSYATQYGFILIGITALIGAWLFVTRREAVYAAIVVVYLGILANDMFRLHVILGDWIDDVWNLQALYQRSGSYVGEAIGFAAIGLVLFAGLLIASLRSSAGHRAVGLLIAVTLVALAAFDGALDLVHAVHLYSSRWLGDVFVVIEEGGELVCLTAALIIVATVAAGWEKLTDSAPAEPVQA